MKNDTLAELEAELRRQDRELAAIETTLRSLDDVELAVPTAFLDELERITTVPTTAPAIASEFAIRC